MINKRIMIIGGTGALGKQLTERWKSGNDILIFSRNEHKQEEMKREYPEALYRIGDVKDKESILRSMYEFKPNVIVNQNICDIQNSGFNCGIPPLSAAKVSTRNRKLKGI